MVHRQYLAKAIIFVFAIPRRVIISRDHTGEIVFLYSLLPVHEYETLFTPV